MVMGKTEDKLGFKLADIDTKPLKRVILDNKLKQEKMRSFSLG